MGEFVLRVLERIGVICEDESGRVEGLSFGGEYDATRLRNVSSNVFDFVHLAKAVNGEFDSNVGGIHDRRHNARGCRS